VSRFYDDGNMKEGKEGCGGANCAVVKTAWIAGGRRCKNDEYPGKRMDSGVAGPKQENFGENTPELSGPAMVRSLHHFELSGPAMVRSLHHWN
jgi:hypothetical protein